MSIARILSWNAASERHGRHRRPLAPTGLPEIAPTAERRAGQVGALPQDPAWTDHFGSCVDLRAAA